jgi:glycosidase
MDPYKSDRDKSASEDGWFDTSMPDINQANPLVLNYLIQNTIWWIEFAELDGLRVDTYSYNDKEAIATWTKKIMAEYPNLNMVGEIWMHDQALISYWQKDSPIGALDSYNSELPSVMDFTLHDAIMQAFKEPEQGWDKGMVRVYENFVNDFLYKDPNNLLVFMENHDTQRFNEYCPSLADYKLALTLIATTRGIPQIYYGSEIGMKGKKEVGDADIRKDFPGGWGALDDHNAFFTNGDVNNLRGMKGRTEQEEAYFQFTKQLLNWRKNQPVIHSGKMKQYVPENNVYVYFRYNESDTLMVIINNSIKEETIKLSRFDEMLSGKSILRDVFTNQDNKLTNTISLPAKTAVVYRVFR